MSALFPDLSPGHLIALHERAGAPACLLLLEVVPGDEGAVVYGHELYPRAWASRGFVRRSPAVLGKSECLPLSPSGELFQAMNVWMEPYGASKSSWAIGLVFDDAVPINPVADLRAHLQSVPNTGGQGPTVAAQRRAGQLFLNERAKLEPLPFVNSSLQFELRLEGSNQIKVDGLKLPLTAGVQFGAAPDRTSLLKVCAVALNGALQPLPAEAWYHLAPPPGLHAMTLNLTLDVCLNPDPARDRWTLSWADGRDGVSLADSPSWMREAPPTLHLAVVFDRTCPDADSWSAARRLFFEKETAPEQISAEIRGVQFAGESGTSPPPPARKNISRQDLNQGLRESFGPVLREELDRFRESFREVIIHPIWFGDTATSEFDPIDGMPLNAPVSDALPPHRLGPEIDRVFRTLRYMPSFDIFDPLELALQAANERLRSRLRDSTEGPVRGAIVIVGNSPPTFVPNGEKREGVALAKYWELARAQFCPRARPGRVRWSSEVEAAAGQGVPIVYALLSIDPSDDGGGDTRIAERIDHVMAMERCTRDALSLFSPQVRVTDGALANAEGLKMALRQALGLVVQSAARQNPSTVILMRQ